MSATIGVRSGFTTVMRIKGRGEIRGPRREWVVQGNPAGTEDKGLATQRVVLRSSLDTEAITRSLSLRRGGKPHHAIGYRGIGIGSGGRIRHKK